MRIDNAALIAQRIYNTGLDLFDEVWAAKRGNVRESVACIIQLAKRTPKDPYVGLRAWVDSSARYSRGARPESCGR
jgi:hypothetical protein